jgi:hypothetical protein
MTKLNLVETKGCRFFCVMCYNLIGVMSDWNRVQSSCSLCLCLQDCRLLVAGFFSSLLFLERSVSLLEL